MLVGELEYDNMVEQTENMLEGHFTANFTNGNQSFIGSLNKIKITDKSVPILFSFTDHLLIAIFIFFMAIIMINLLFGLAVTDVQVFHK